MSTNSSINLTIASVFIIGWPREAISVQGKVAAVYRFRALTRPAAICFSSKLSPHCRAIRFLLATTAGRCQHPIGPDFAGAIVASRQEIGLIF
jgi:hypothetical protein